MQTCALASVSQPILSTTNFHFNQSDFRTGVLLFKNSVGNFISIVDTLSGNILASTEIPGEDLGRLENIEVKQSSYVRVLTLKSQSDGNGRGDETSHRIVVANPALESAVSKIRFEFPQVVKNAYSIASEFSPLSKEVFSSTRPMNILVD